MISLKRSIEELEWHEKRFEAALECYLAMLDCLRRFAIEADGDSTQQHQLRLQTLQRDVLSDSSPEALRNSRGVLEGEVGSYSKKVTEFYDRRHGDLRDIILLLGEAIETMSVRNVAYNNEIKGFSCQIEAVARMENLADVRRSLAKRVVDLRICMNRLWLDGQSGVSQMQAKLKHFETRLAEAEVAACTDPLTGLFNRREGERILRERVAEGNQFCLVVMDLNRFKAVNDRWGHSAGDQVLKAVAAQLLKSVRANDTVCRWGGDEFVVMMDCGLGSAMQRGSQLGEKLRRHYVVEVGENEVRVDISASLGIAQYSAGETPEQLFTRADAALYRLKPARSGEVEVRR